MTIFEQRESNIRAYCRVYPVVFDKADNARQTDTNGKQYIDFFAGAGVLNFGHNNPKMTEAVVDYIQNKGITHSLDMHTLAKQAFMQTFTDIILKPRQMPHKMQFMGPTGTNAVEAALKLARRVTGRQQVVAFSHGFHGMTLGSLACTANSYYRGAAGVSLDHVSHYPFDAGLHALETLRGQLLDSSSGLEKPAAFLLETIQAEGGVFVASQAWFKALADLAKEVGALLIVDDIQVGCGRTGSYFSFDGSGVMPDIVCLAKGIGGWGTPMAMNLVKPEYDAQWSPGEHTGTFRGQNLSFVAGKVALEYFRDDALMRDVSSKAEVMNSYLKPLARRHSYIDIRGKGMIIGLDVGDGELAKNIAERCFAAGLLIATCGEGGRVLKLIPPLTIPDADLREGLQILVDCTEHQLEVAA